VRPDRGLDVAQLGEPVLRGVEQSLRSTGRFSGCGERRGGGVPASDRGAERLAGLWFHVDVCIHLGSSRLKLPAAEKEMHPRGLTAVLGPTAVTCRVWTAPRMIGPRDEKSDQPMWTWTSWSSPRGWRIAAKYWSCIFWRSAIVFGPDAFSACTTASRGFGLASPTPALDVMPEVPSSSPKRFEGCPISE
jgi:hypothetical protein